MYVKQSRSLQHEGRSLGHQHQSHISAGRPVCNVKSLHFGVTFWCQTFENRTLLRCSLCLPPIRNALAFCWLTDAKMHALGDLKKCHKLCICSQREREKVSRTVVEKRDWKSGGLLFQPHLRVEDGRAGEIQVESGPDREGMRLSPKENTF